MLKSLKSSVQKIIINSGATDHFFSNRAYFSKYEEYHYEFQTGSGEVLAAHGYGDVVLCFANPDGSEVISTIKKVSLAPSLEHNLLSTIPLAKKRVEVFLPKVQVPIKISHHGELFGVDDIINNQYVIRTTGYFPNNSLGQENYQFGYPYFHSNLASATMPFKLSKYHLSTQDC